MMTIQLKKQRKEKICIILCLILCFISLEFSTTKISIFSLLDIIVSFFKQQSLTQEQELSKVIFLDIRIPRLLATILCACALGVSGVISQAIFRNPLASPSIIGSTSGATLGAVLAIAFNFAWLDTMAIPFMAFFGSLLTTLIVLFFITVLKNKFIDNLLLTGFAISTFISAITSFVMSIINSNPHKTAAIFHWSMGSFSNVTWEKLLLAAIPICYGLLRAKKMSQRLDVYLLGEESATCFGINPRPLKIKAIFLISLLVGSSTSLCGPLPFVGLIVPHISRFIFGPNHERLVRTSMINSVSLLVIADILAKNLLLHKEIELGVLTSLLGAPFFIWLVFKEGSHATYSK